MDVSVIIVNYNTISLLVDAVDSVFEKTEGIKYEIIVVDNASSDNSKNILADKYGDKIIYLALSENIGFGRANNEAVKIANGRNLFFLNPDTILLNNAVKILSDYLDDNPRVGCCGGNLFDADGNPAYSFGRIVGLSIFSEINELFLKIPEKIIYGKNVFYNYKNKPMRVGYITGADLMIRKKLFTKLDGFDPDFFMYYEESELEYRVSKAGYEISSIPYAQIVHLEGKSFPVKIDSFIMMWSSRKIFLRKTCNSMKIFVINKIFVIRITIFLFVVILLQNKEKINLWLKMYRIVNFSKYK